MSELVCWKCGAGLAELSLPLGRLDECPSCTVHLHVCRMCRHYDAAVTKACREDDAEEVRDKQSANFCDYFKPAPGAFDAAAASTGLSARQQAEALFGGGEDLSGGDGADLDEADDLFRQ